MIPFLVLSLAALGLNILTGYTGLISLGTAAFMGVGAYSCYKLTTFFRDVNIIVTDPGLRPVLGCDSSRRSSACPRCGSRASISPIATLAAQFFLAMGSSCACPGCTTTTPRARSRCRSVLSSACRSPAPPRLPRSRSISSCLGIVVRADLVRFEHRPWQARGVHWKAVRDMDIAAELMGIKLLNAKLTRLRRVVLFRRGRRGDDDLPLVWRRRGQ
jgi:branched-chain amino acid transport system permease protein